MNGLPIVIQNSLITIDNRGRTMNFGDYTKQLREQRHRISSRYSVRQMALRVGIKPGYLSRLERGEVSPPPEETILRLAADLGEDPDILLALAGQIAADVREIIVQRPLLFAELIRGLSDLPDHQLTTLVQQVRNSRY